MNETGGNIHFIYKGWNRSAYVSYRTRRVAQLSHVGKVSLLY
jgi:hypothetical protein